MTAEPHDPLRGARQLAVLLDGAWGIPFTRWRIGIDSLLGLLPLAGDLLSALLSLTIVWQGHKLKAPKRLQARLLGNIALDFVVGSIPIVGDLADVVLRKNQRNVALLDNWLAASAQSKTPSSDPAGADRPVVSMAGRGYGGGTLSGNANMSILPHSKLRAAALLFVFFWFFAGGLGHFLAADFFANIMPDYLPWHYPAVYISGVFELLGAFALFYPPLRRWAGIGLFVLTLVVTPVNVHMWLNPQDFPDVSEAFLSIRLLVQVFLLFCIWWSTQDPSPKTQTA